MLSKRVVLVVVALSCLFALTPSALFSQASSAGTIDGTVTDASGAAVAGATVTLTDTGTNTSRTATTNETGRYLFINVPPGTYNLTVNKTGFRIARFTNQAVSVGTTLTLNVALEVGSVAQTVEVTATNADLQTMNATVGNTVSGVMLSSLPSIGRDASTFVTLQPGVAPDGSVAGAVYDQNSFTLDGGQNTNDMDGSMNIYTPSFAGDTTGGLIGAAVTGNAGGGPTGTTITPRVRRSPATILAALGSPAADPSFPRTFWAGRPSSSPTMRAFAGRTQRQGNGPCRAIPCVWDCCISRRASRTVGRRMKWTAPPPTTT